MRVRLILTFLLFHLSAHAAAEKSNLPRSSVEAQQLELDPHVKNIILKSELQYAVGGANPEIYTDYFINKLKKSKKCIAQATCVQKLESLKKKLKIDEGDRNKFMKDLSILLTTKFTAQEIVWLSNWYSNPLYSKIQQFMSSNDIIMLSRQRQDRNLKEQIISEAKKAGLDLEY